ncbi:MAG: ACP S-malonyltransferase [Solirubrobacteraceae bacterium]|nr:ACP S-malonyltransferase [Solirubrobacteraceae bacterium]
MGVVLLCPGQGALPRDLPELIRASGEDLAQAYAGRLGPDAWDDPLADFARQQAALVTIGIGRGRRAQALLSEPTLAAEHGPVVATAGHSLGELVALTLAGVLEPADAVRLAADRGAAFQQHRLPVWDEAGMLAVRGPTVHDVIDDLLARHGAEYGNDNAPDQVVATGLRSALDAVAVEAKSMGLRAVALETTGPTHSSFMQPVGETFRGDLQGATFASPAVPVYSGYSAAQFTDYVDELASIVAGRVRWRETLVAIAGQDPAPTIFLDIGPGKVLANLARKTVPDIPVMNLDDLEAAA